MAVSEGIWFTVVLNLVVLGKLFPRKDVVNICGHDSKENL